MLTLDFRGALAGSLISFGSAPFELVKVRLSPRVIEYPTVLMTLAPIVSPPCCNDSRSDASLSTRSLPPRVSVSHGLPALSELSEISRRPEGCWGCTPDLNSTLVGGTLPPRDH